jgi:small GTP-binding protein
MSVPKPPPTRPRVITIGDSSVGKTSIINALIGNGFNPYEQSTIGANWHFYVEIVKGEPVELQLWDTAGQERYRSLVSVYYRNSVAVLVVYDITNRDSFKSVPGWIEAFRSVAGTENAVFVVGNKSDLRDRRTVTFEEASEWAQEMGFDFFETSARTSDGISLLFQVVAERVRQLQCTGSDTNAVTTTTNTGCC